jgi:hypothetical protein
MAAKQYTYSKPAFEFESLIPFEQRDWIARHFTCPPALQEIPLLLVPQRHILLPKEHLQTRSEIISALKAWQQLARQDDMRLLIRRPWIPFVEAYFPDTEAGRETYQIAKDIGAIPRQCGIVPTNQNQRFWLKTIHYLWQAQGLLFAQKLSKLSNDLLQENIDRLRQYLSEQSFKNAVHIAETDFALYQAIIENFEYLKTNSFDRRQQQTFSTPWLLFKAIQKEICQTGWKIGPAGSDINGVSQDQQKEYLHTKSYLIENKPWLEGKQVQKGLRRPYQEDEAAFTAYLKQGGLYGQIILALRSKPHSAELENYAKSIRQRKDAYLNDLQWRNGQPYKYKVTSSPQPVEGDVDFCGYIRWYWR